MLVNKFAKDMIDVGEVCRRCNMRLDLGRIWEHLEECGIGRETDYNLGQMRRLEIRFWFCMTMVLHEEYGAHMTICSVKRCEACDTDYNRLEETAHLRICQPAIVPLLMCDVCGLEKGEGHDWTWGTGHVVAWRDCQ